MITSEKSTKRKKVNFMVDINVLEKFQQWVPAGERSDFVNHTLEEAVRRYKRKKAFEGMDELRERAHIRMTSKEMIKRKNYGRP